MNERTQYFIRPIGLGKKIIAALVTLIACAIMLPAAAHADTAINKIEVSEIIQPGIGAEPSYGGIIPEDNNYDISEISGVGKKIGWLEGKAKPTHDEITEYTNRSYASTDVTGVHISKFQAKRYYTVFITLVADSGYVFSDKISATINGKDAQVERLDTTIIEVYYTYSPVTTFNKIELSNVTTPAAGVAPDWKCSAASSAKYYLNNPIFSDMGPQSIAWYEGNEKLTADDLNDYLVTQSVALSSLKEFLGNLHFESGLNYWSWANDNPLNSFTLGKTYSFVALVYAKEGFSYEDNTTVTVNGKKGVIALDDSRVAAVISYGYDPAQLPQEIFRISLSESAFVYTGKAITPTVLAKNAAGITLDEGIDYTVTYTNNKKVGEATAVITGKGAYFGTTTKTFTIKPLATKIKRIKASKKSVKLRWSKRSKQVTGYQIRYSTSSKFAKKKTKTIKVKSYKTTSKKVSKLKSKKKYYFKIRTYKKVGGKTYYSSWSKVKAKKVK